MYLITSVFLPTGSIIAFQMAALHQKNNLSCHLHYQDGSGQQSTHFNGDVVGLGGVANPEGTCNQNGDWRDSRVYGLLFRCRAKYQ
jgi:hypothetical protein